MGRVAVFSLVLILAVPAAWPATLSTVTMADEVTVGDAKLVLNGQGLRKKLWVEVYVAGLYMPQKTSDAAAAAEIDGTKRIVMHFLTNKAKKKKMDAAWDEGFEGNSPEIYDELKARVATFKDFFGDMKVGDVIELTLVPGVGTSASLNGTEKGVIEGDDFAEALLKVWLGASPPSEDLKNGLLGL